MSNQTSSAAAGRLVIGLSAELPPEPKFEPGIRRAPHRGFELSAPETIIALKNALRYIPQELHRQLAPEFLEELLTRGRIYGYRYRPAGRIKARPIEEYQGRTLEGRALQLMIENNLDFIRFTYHMVVGYYITIR